MAKMSMKDDLIEVSRSVREAQPAHYLFKIESFSMFVEEDIDKLESDAFEVGGYKWRLILYPSGNKETNGSEYVSLYLAMMDTDKMPDGWELNVHSKFFVYNHLEDNYLMIQDSGDKTRRLHPVKTECGFSQLMSQEQFNDKSNGYLFHDSCVFGAEIYVITSSAKRECVSLIKEPKGNFFTWSVVNFSSITAPSLFSDEFTVGEHNWRLQLYPKNCRRSGGEWLSLFLCLADSSKSSLKHRLFVKSILRIKDQVSKKDYEKEVKVWFSSTNSSWGYAKFKELSDVNDLSNGFTVKDTLIVEVDFLVISVVKKLT